MKRIIRLFSLLLIFVLLFSFTSCTGENGAKFKSLELADENTALKRIDENIAGKKVTPLALSEAESEEKVIFIGYVEVVSNKLYLKDAQLPEIITSPFAALYVYASAVDAENANYGFVGVLEVDPENASERCIYTINSVVEYDEQELIFTELDDEGNVPFPTMAVSGSNFSGWYYDNTYAAGTRVANIADLGNVEKFNGVLYARYLGYGEAGIVAVICVAIVFAMLALLWLIVSLLKFVNKLNKPKKVEEAPAPVVAAPKQPIKLEDIKDDDMMAAALVATIDYHEETKEDVRVVSIKEIK